MIRTLRNALLPCALALLVLGGCASEPPPTDTSQDDGELAIEEPVTGLPEAPPLGAPRPKVTPGELKVDEDRD